MISNHFFRPSAWNPNYCLDCGERFTAEIHLSASSSHITTQEPGEADKKVGVVAAKCGCGEGCGHERCEGDDVTTRFRLLNSHEITALWNLHYWRLNPHTTTVSYESMQGGFCICLIRIVSDHDGTVSLLRGASRRSYEDRRNRVTGEMKAFVRALRYSKPIVIGRMDQVQVTGTVKCVDNVTPHIEQLKRDLDRIMHGDDYDLDLEDKTL